MRIFKPTSATLVLLWSVLNTNATFAAPKKLPIDVRLEHAKGFAWLHVDGNPMARKYEFNQEKNTYCQFNAGVYHYTDTPNSEHTSVSLTYFDHEMSEDDNQAASELELSWLPNRSDLSPFIPRDVWNDKFSVHGMIGETITTVSYNRKLFKTTFVSEKNAGLIWYTKTEVFMDSEYKEVKRVRVATAYSKNFELDNLQELIECWND